MRPAGSTRPSAATPPLGGGQPTRPATAPETAPGLVAADGGLHTAGPRTGAAPGEGALGAGAARRLSRRWTLRVDPTRGAALKRNVHELEIAADAAAFGAALEAVLIDPAASFAGLRLKRLPERLGRPFEVGERFHGCLSLQLALARTPLRPLSDGALVGPLLAGIEDALLSDYAEILELAPGRVVYGYLSGSPIAGRSTLEIAPRGPGRCRFRATFEFQEVSPVAIAVLHRFGVRAHDAVIVAQVEAAARLAGGRITKSTIRLA